MPNQLKSLQKLHELIGLKPVKDQVDALISQVVVNSERKKRGNKVPEISHHMAFLGSPGTGKTSVARIVGEIYKELGILEKGHVVETDRSGLVGQYIGHTAIKTNELIDKAMGGILFIDEAYSLVSPDSGRDFGPEAISTLIARMENERNKFVVILAGYTDVTKQMIKSNPGMQSRIAHYITFPDYEPEDLYWIFISMTGGSDQTVTAKAQAILLRAFELVHSKKDKNFGNGRLVRNVVEKVMQNQAIRLNNKYLSFLPPKKLNTIHSHDIIKTLIDLSASEYGLNITHEEIEKLSDGIVIAQFIQTLKNQFSSQKSTPPIDLQNFTEDDPYIDAAIPVATSERMNQTPSHLKSKMPTYKGNKKTWVTLVSILCILAVAGGFFHYKKGNAMDPVTDAVLITSNNMENLLGYYYGAITTNAGESKAVVEIVEISGNKVLAYLNIYSGNLNTGAREYKEFEVSEGKLVSKELGVLGVLNIGGTLTLQSNSSSLSVLLTKAKTNQ